jgi:atypical dual specificity phosphatase
MAPWRLWNLQEEKEFPRNFSWVIESKLAGCGRPESEAQLRCLRDAGIKAIISLTGTSLYPEPVNRLGFEYMHSHISGAPSPIRLSEIIDFIDARNQESKPVLVHCEEGKGRTGTVLAAYLVSKGSTAEEALHKVRELRPGSIETHEQENAVRLFEKTRSGT